MATAPATAPAAAPAAAAPPDSWMYSADGQPKGPLPGFSLLRLLERGVVPPTATVWAPHLKEWAPITEADGLAVRAKLCRQRFYVMDQSQRQGPFILGELRRRFEAGEIDGLSQIFVEGSEAWQQLSDVAGLRDVLQPPQLQQEVAVEAYEPDQTEELPKEKTRSFKGDDGVSYVFRDGDWVPGEASDSDEEVPPEKPVPDQPKKKKRKKKAGWDAKTTKCWIYVTGLPPDATAEELAEHFGKCGAIARDLENAPKIKLYKDDAGALKGDASLCYANASSVDVACSILDGGSLRFDVPLRVTKADFGSARYGAFDQSKGKKVNPQKAHVARRAQRQAQNWSYDVDSGASPENAMRIVVVESCFSLEDAPAQEVLDEGKSKYDLFAESVQKELLALLEGGGAPLDRAVVHRHGVVVFKFKEPSDAQKSVKVWDACEFRGRTLKAAFWDGVTDYTRVAKEAEEKAEGGEEKRIDAFGDWLEDQGELPPELQLRVEE